MMLMAMEMTSQPATSAQSAMSARRSGERRGRGGAWGAAGMAGLYRRARAWSSRVAGPALAALVALTAGAPGGARAAEGARHPLDAHRGPVIGSSRVIGLGGAYAGVGEGIEGFFSNPAAVANRTRYSVDWFDYDLSFDTLLTPGGEIDFDNDGASAPEGSAFNAGNVAASLLFGRLGLGVAVLTSGYELFGSDGARVSNINALDVLLGVGYAFAEGEWVVGLGWGLRALEIGDFREGGSVVQLQGDALDVGVLWRPPAQPWRFGAHLKLPTTPRELQVVSGDPGDEAPGAARFPWQVTVGASRLVLIGKRKYNLPVEPGAGWGSERPLRDRRYVLLSADLRVVGPADGAVGFESFLAGAPLASGDRASVGLHVGAEAEVVHDRLRVRLGGYNEPSRTRDDAVGRLHLTGGAELRLFELWRWDIKASAGFDVAPRYSNLLFGVGFWH